MPFLSKLKTAAIIDFDFMIDLLDEWQLFSRHFIEMPRFVRVKNIIGFSLLTHGFRCTAPIAVAQDYGC